MIKRNILDCMSLVGSAPFYFKGEKIYVSTGAVECDNIDYNQIEMVTYTDRPSRANLVVEDGDILFAKMYGTKKTLRILCCKSKRICYNFRSFVSSINK